MGAAAYNRGSRAIADQIDRERGDRVLAAEKALIHALNTEPKRDGAARPFGPILFIPGNGGWWAQCPVTGFGYYYRTLREAVRAFRVLVVSVGMRDGEVCYTGVPS